MTRQGKTTSALTNLSNSQLSEKDLRFIEMRKRFLKPSNYVGLSFLVFLAAIFLWLSFKAPNLINPFEVERQIAANTLSASAIKVMAALLPLMVMVAFFLTVSIILFGFWAFSNERTYLKIIEGLLAGSQKEGKPSSPAERDLRDGKKKNPSGKKK